MTLNIVGAVAIALSVALAVFTLERLIFKQETLKKTWYAQLRLLLMVFIVALLIGQFERAISA
jgi:asparagine N-glycosylation enzyme membrane subunit Stt3